MIKHGFDISNGIILDTRINIYRKKIVSVDNNLIYSLIPIGYKRLYYFEPLLDHYTVEQVFDILRLNKKLSKAREKNDNNISTDNYSNTMMVYNYPIKYLSPRMFQMYKSIQRLKDKIE